MIVKLIRSKGVGIFFVTQSPEDIPASILGQLGLKIQHALRALTVKERKPFKLHLKITLFLSSLIQMKLLPSLVLVKHLSQQLVNKADQQNLFTL
jgi:DNA helicase HerA-like ATPase